MIDNSNKSKDVEGSQLISGKSSTSKTNQFNFVFGSVDTLIPVGAATLQILTGLTLISLSILGLITPSWFSVILSIGGSVSCMAGVFLIYHTSAKKGTFESLINQAIRRVIDSQN